MTVLDAIDPQGAAGGRAPGSSRSRNVSTEWRVSRQEGA
jgi:hypothetical protein